MEQVLHWLVHYYRSTTFFLSLNYLFFFHLFNLLRLVNFRWFRFEIPNLSEMILLQLLAVCFKYIAILVAPKFRACTSPLHFNFPINHEGWLYL